jgi:PAS domain S-box-containing protein
MKDKSLRVLIIEDSENDTLLIIRNLKKGGYNPLHERVETAAAMKKALKEKQWDIILCDYSLSKFNAPSAIAILKETNIDIPLIVITGAIGEETAAECMRLGAQDFIMKGNMSRLCPAIARELEDAEIRNKEKQAEEKLRHEEQRFRAFIEHSSDIIVIMNREGIITYVNPAVERVLGFKPEERIGAKGFELIHPDDMKFLTDSFNTLVRDTNSPVIQGEMRLHHKNGSWRTLEAVGSNLIYNNVVESIIVNYRDITERKLAEEKLRESEANYRQLFDNSPAAIYRVDYKNGRFLKANDIFCEYLGYRQEELISLSPYDVLTEESKKLFLERMEKIAMGVEVPKTVEFEIVDRKGKLRCLQLDIKNIYDTEGHVVAADVVANDIPERKKEEEKLRLTLESLRNAHGAIIQVMVSAIEMRDPYTSGHQIRSADLARAIATEMGLSKEQIDGIRLAGSIHDIGKLSVPAEILSKPTKLTDLEFSLIKEHSLIGYEMLKGVESSWPLAQIVYQHHERMNGSGYPRNLKGDEILIDARIMAVADVVESMASHRPYRPSLGIEAALEEIEKNKGILYDDTVADVCLRLFREKDYSLVLKKS